MPTLVCVPIFVDPEPEPAGVAPSDPIQAALDDASLAKAKGADLVEFRIDRFFSGSSHPADPSAADDPSIVSHSGASPSEDAYTVAQLHRLLAESPLPVILTCRPTWEGGDYDGDDSDRVALFERLCCDSPHPPAYLDVELAAYTRSANLRQKINLCVAHPMQKRQGITTRLILSTHDFETRPGDLDRRLLAMYDEPACAVVKVAHRARSLRDNLDLFEILRESPKPTIALGMGEFGLMSRVLAPKFNGFLTFASLRDESATAPGQPTIDDLLGMDRFHSIGKQTRLYGVIGWPVGHSLSPLIHNAGFAEIGWDGVYLPLPIAADQNDPRVNATSFSATVGALADEPALHFSGASVTLPHKEHATAFGDPVGELDPSRLGAANTLAIDANGSRSVANTDATAILELLESHGVGSGGDRIGIVGAGGVARAAAYTLVSRGATVVIFNRTPRRAESMAASLNGIVGCGGASAADLSLLPTSSCAAYINCTPVGMTGGPDPDGLSIPIPDMTNIDENTVFFDTVYNPVETPMLKAARARGSRTIDGVEMFVKQAATQFTLWTGKPAPIELFDRLCREKLA